MENTPHKFNIELINNNIVRNKNNGLCYQFESTATAQQEIERINNSTGLERAKHIINRKIGQKEPFYPLSGNTSDNILKLNFEYQHKNNLHTITFPDYKLQRSFSKKLNAEYFIGMLAITNPIDRKELLIKYGAKKEDTKNLIKAKIGKL